MFRRRRPVDDFAAEIESHLQLEIDRLSDQELTDLTARLCRQVLSRRQLAMPLAIPGENQKPIRHVEPLVYENVHLATRSYK